MLQSARPEHRRASRAQDWRGRTDQTAHPGYILARMVQCMVNRPQSADENSARQNVSRQRGIVPKVNRCGLVQEAYARPGAELFRWGIGRLARRRFHQPEARLCPQGCAGRGILVRLGARRHRDEPVERACWKGPQILGFEIEQAAQDGFKEGDEAAKALMVRAGQEGLGRNGPEAEPGLRRRGKIAGHGPPELDQAKQGGVRTRLHASDPDRRPAAPDWQREGG